MIRSRNLDMVEMVAAGLKGLRDRVVFVGGASTCLHIDDPAAEMIRPTDDVDCAVGVTNRIGYSDLEKQLCALGFTHVTEQGAPLCRWRYQDVVVDVMPDLPEILGFSNRWYSLGILHAKQVVLPSGLSIRCFTLPYFIASKLEAFNSRGGDCRMSHDIEDIVLVLDGKLDFDELYHAPDDVAVYLKEQFKKLLNDSSFMESVSAHLALDSSSDMARAERILGVLRNI
jgi:hypothetical protein